MAQELVQTQEQRLQQLQRLTAMQVQQIKLLEMPLTELEESIKAELDDNPALERADTEESLDSTTDGMEPDPYDDTTDGGEDSYEEQSEKEEREDALDTALESMGQDDEMPDVHADRYQAQDADYEEMVYGDTESFYDKLKEQMDMQVLTDQEKQVMEYLIGSLDGDGLLRKSLDTISDELAIYQGLDLTTEDIEQVLHKLQTFDPAGVGARDLPECLLLQIRRKPKGPLRKTMEQVVTEVYDEFTKKHWDKIQTELDLNDTQTETIREEMLKLNPKPGAALGETMGRNVQQITPDFIVDTADDGTISFTLNQGELPELTVSPSFVEMINNYRKLKTQPNRQEREAYLYAKDKVMKAQGFITAIKMRQHSLIATMQTIIDIQRKFFLDGDEADLKPMILQNVADRTGLDRSTISRVGNVKYVQTKWGIFPLKFFFTDRYNTGNGEETSTRRIKMTLRELILNEDKKKPLSDGTLARLLKEKGFPIARRTVTKYRIRQGFPVARLRKE